MAPAVAARRFIQTVQNALRQLVLSSLHLRQHPMLLVRGVPHRTTNGRRVQAVVHRTLQLWARRREQLRRL